MGRLQVRTILFQVSEHFFDPHPQTISSQSLLLSRQVGGQQPGLLFARLAIGKDIDPLSMLGSQQATLCPHLLSGLVDQAIQALKVLLALLFDQVAPFLT